MRYLDRIANLAVVIGVAVFLTLAARGDFSRHVVKNAHPSPLAAGTSIRLPGVQWPPSQDTLVLGISATCHFCKDSLPFYRQLAAQLQGRVNVVAVLPQEQNEADAFLQRAGVTGVKVVSQDLGKIGVYATPTLLLVDSTGKVKDSWVGELDADHQKKLLAAALPPTTAAVPRS